MFFRQRLWSKRRVQKNGRNGGRTHGKTDENLDRRVKAEEPEILFVNIYFTGKTITLLMYYFGGKTKIRVDYKGRENTRRFSIFYQS